MAFVLIAATFVSLRVLGGGDEPPPLADDQPPGGFAGMPTEDPGTLPEVEPTPEGPAGDVEDAPEGSEGRSPIAGEEAIAEIQGLLDRFAARYNGGDHAGAAEAFTERVRRRCGGGTALAEALRQNHEVERMRYRFEGVVPWPDRPLADVVVIEDFGDDDTFRVTLGLRFGRERGSWLLDVPFPVGVRDFCPS